MRIYLTGAHSVGKTTLARYLAKQYNLPLVTEVVRKIAASTERSLQELRVDLNAVDALQLNIFKEQLDAEKQLVNFVSDRAFDFIAYTAEHTRKASEIYNSEAFKIYMGSLTAADVIVFFVRPHKQLITNDSFRTDLDYESICRIDGQIKLLLEVFDIPYITVSCVNMKERTDLCRRIIDLMLKDKK